MVKILNDKLVVGLSVGCLWVWPNSDCVARVMGDESVEKT
ncbi:unnamed protein product [Brassica rapa subsp. narinosa]